MLENIVYVVLIFLYLTIYETPMRVIIATKNAIAIRIFSSMRPIFIFSNLSEKKNDLFSKIEFTFKFKVDYTNFFHFIVIALI